MYVIGCVTVPDLVVAVKVSKALTGHLELTKQPLGTQESLPSPVLS